MSAHHFPTADTITLDEILVMPIGNIVHIEHQGQQWKLNFDTIKTHFPHFMGIRGSENRLQSDDLRCDTQIGMHSSVNVLSPEFAQELKDLAIKIENEKSQTPNIIQPTVQKTSTTPKLGQAKPYFDAALDWVAGTALPAIKKSSRYTQNQHFGTLTRAFNTTLTLVAAASLAPQSNTFDETDFIPVARVDLPAPNIVPPAPAVKKYWHGITDAQLERTNLNYSLKNITDPEMRLIITDYTSTGYFQNAFKNPEHVETNRLWPIAAAAGIQELWDNPKHRAFLKENSFDEAEKSLMTLLLFAETESYFGSELGNKVNKRVGGIWHLEDKTLISIARQYFSADELGLNENGDAKTWATFQKYAKEHGKRLMKRHDNDARDFINKGVPKDMQDMRDRVLKNGRYGRVAAKLVLILHADNVKRSIRVTSLTAESFRKNPSLLYGMHVLGMKRFNGMIRQNADAKMANFSRWKGIKNQNPSLVCVSYDYDTNKKKTSNCISRTKSGLMQEFNTRFTTLPVKRLQSATSSSTRIAVNWDLAPHLRYIK